LENFYQRCGLPSFIDHAQEEKLKLGKMLTDLDSLFNSITPPKNIPTLIIGSDNDKIVPPIVLHDNFSNCSNVKVEINPSGNHALGFLEVDKIYKKITSFIDNADEKKN
jgi:pimeloyl-ACP methyl ester carboxylesterase